MKDFSRLCKNAPKTVQTFRVASNFLQAYKYYTSAYYTRTKYNTKRSHPDKHLTKFIVTNQIVCDSRYLEKQRYTKCTCPFLKLMRKRYNILTQVRWTRNKGLKLNLQCNKALFCCSIRRLLLKSQSQSDNQISKTNY